MTVKNNSQAQRPKIVITDGYTTNPGDLSWDAFEKLGDLTVYERSTSEEAVQRCADADIVMSNKITWTADMIEQLKDCKLIQLLSTGFNVVDYSQSNKQRITVCNVPAYSTPDVAQHTMALILETTNHVAEYSESVRLGNWIESRDFTYYLDPIVELEGKTLGIVGMGSIGQTVAKLARAFGMEIIFENPHPKPQLEGPHCKQVSLDDLLANADIVTLHCPLTPENKGMVNADFLAKMKPGTTLIDTARGGLINSADIAKSLEDGHLGYYAADVSEEEPMAMDDPLRIAPHTTITPHIAWAATAARKRLIDQATKNVEAFLDGKPINVVPPVKFD